MVNRPRLSRQVAHVAIVLPPRPSLMSLGAFIDSVTLLRAYIARQYSVIDPVSPSQGYGVAKFDFIRLEDQPPTVEGIALPLAQGIPAEGYHEIVILIDFDEQERAVDTIDITRLGGWLHRCHREGSLIVASGASVLLAAATGLLRSRAATGPWWLAGRLCALAPGAAFDFSRNLVEEGGVMTTAGPVADSAAAAAVMERITSRNTALWLSRRMGQVQGSVDEAEDPLLMRAIQYLTEHFSTPVNMAELAGSLGVSARTLARRFAQGAGMSPLGYVQFLRIEAAKRMLERSPFRVEVIAGLVGYSDVDYFRRMFRRATGATPRQWRKASAYADPMGPDEPVDDR